MMPDNNALPCQVDEGPGGLTAALLADGLALVQDWLQQWLVPCLPAPAPEEGTI